MNLVNGEINKENGLGRQNQYDCSLQCFVCGGVRIFNNRIINSPFQEKQILFSQKNKILIALSGEIHEGADCKKEFPFVQHDLDLILELYLKKGLRSLNQLDGLFNCVVLDFNLRKLWILQDRFMSLDHIYFYDGDKKFVFANDLKFLLRKIDKKQVNADCLPSYLKYSYVPSQDTLFRGIHKIPLGKMLVYNFSSADCSLVPNHYEPDGKRYAEKEETYLELLDESLHVRLTEGGNKRFGLPLSGGFDTNLILARILKHRWFKKIRVFTIGSSAQDSELPIVRKIIKEYRKRGLEIELIKYVVNGHEINDLPQIIFDYSEPITQSGIILRKCLSELMKKHRVDIGILGEGADQVFRCGIYRQEIFYKKFRQEDDDSLYRDNQNILFFRHCSNQELGKLLKQKSLSDPYCHENPVWVFNNYCLLKQIHLKFNQITVRLPFLNNKLVDFVQENCDFSEKKDKQFQKMVVAGVLPDAIFTQLGKKGGTTPSELLFHNRQYNSRLFHYLLQSGVVHEYFNVSFIELLISHLKEENSPPWLKKHAADVLLCILGFVAWHLLFISSDRYLKEEKCTTDLIRLLKSEFPRA